MKSHTLVGHVRGPSRRRRAGAWTERAAAAGKSAVATSAKPIEAMVHTNQSRHVGCANTAAHSAKNNDVC